MAALTKDRVFETLDEASEYASSVLKNTGIVLGVFEDARPATHIMQKKR